MACTVLHAPITFAEGYPELPGEPYGILAGIGRAKAFRKDRWGAEIDATMAPSAGEIVIEGKRGLDCFATTNLDFILRRRGITPRCPLKAKGVGALGLTRVAPAIGNDSYNATDVRDYPVTFDKYLTRLPGLAQGYPHRSPDGCGCTTTTTHSPGPEQRRSHAF